MSGNISTHVLNLANGKPGSEIWASLFILEEEGPVGVPNWKELSRKKTDSDGRVSPFLGANEGPLVPGRYRIQFDLQGYFLKMGLESFLPEAVLAFEVKDASEHFHVPLLLSPNGFTTYRGS